MFEDLQHDEDVTNLRDVMENDRFIGEESSGKTREDLVFATIRSDGTGKGGAPLNDEFIHNEIRRGGGRDMEEEGGTRKTEPKRLGFQDGTRHEGLEADFRGDVFKGTSCHGEGTAAHAADVIDEDASDLSDGDEDVVLAFEANEEVVDILFDVESLHDAEFGVVEFGVASGCEFEVDARIDRLGSEHHAGVGVYDRGSDGAVDGKYVVESFVDLHG